MVERIFISYRRDDSAGHAGRVFDRLRTDFKESVLFMDVDAIPLGANFARVLEEEVGRCSVLLAIIGPRWLEAMDEHGERRLDNPNDFVRVEIAAALARDIPVIPILLDGARIPKPSVLPADLAELSQRNGLDVRHASFHADMDKLVRGLRDPSRQGLHDPDSNFEYLYQGIESILSQSGRGMTLREIQNELAVRGLQTGRKRIENCLVARQFLDDDLVYLGEETWAIRRSNTHRV